VVVCAKFNENPLIGSKVINKEETDADTSAPNHIIHMTPSLIIHVSVPLEQGK
jgi:hypothetical protein